MYVIWASTTNKVFQYTTLIPAHPCCPWREEALQTLMPKRMLQGGSGGRGGRHRSFFWLHGVQVHLDRGALKNQKANGGVSAPVHATGADGVNGGVIGCKPPVRLERLTKGTAQNLWRNRSSKLQLAKDKVLLEVGLRTLTVRTDQDGKVFEGGAAWQELVRCGSMWSSLTTRKLMLYRCWLYSYVFTWALSAYEVVDGDRPVEHHLGPHDLLVHAMAGSMLRTVRSAIAMPM